jgi:Ni,Fe-hydrogenase III component G
MQKQEILDNLKQRFKDDIIDFFDKSPRRLYVGIKPEALVKISTYVFKDLGARFNIASGIDCRRHIEILYHFTFDDINLTVSLRVILSRDTPRIDSLAKTFEAANWIEREMHELLGIDFTGHPDLRKLLLPENWPDGSYPLRYDYKEWDKDAIRDRGV